MKSPFKFLASLLILLLFVSCNNETENKASNDFPNQALPSQDEKKVSNKFIGQTYSRSSKDSFGHQTQTFSFEKKGKGNFAVGWTVYGKFHDDQGELFWEIIDGEIHINYTYRASNGDVTREKAIFEYDEVKNKLISTEYDSEVYSCISTNKSENIGENSFSEAEYNRQQEQAEYESSQAYYNSNTNFESIMTFIECSCGAHDCGLIFKDNNGKNHEFYQSEINNYDFECPKGLRFRNRKFTINYESDNQGNENIVSISELN